MYVKSSIYGVNIWDSVKNLRIGCELLYWYFVVWKILILTLFWYIYVVLQGLKYLDCSYFKYYYHCNEIRWKISTCRIRDNFDIIFLMRILLFLIWTIEEFKWKRRGIFKNTQLHLMLKSLFRRNNLFGNWRGRAVNLN